MPSRRHSPSPLRASVLRVLLVASLAGAVAAGCGGTTTCADGDCSSGGAGGGSSTGGGGAACTSTKGTISGTVYLSPPPSGQVAANATVTFVVSPGGPGAEVLNGQADADGKFSVEIDPGTWLVSGTEPSGCIPEGPVTVELDTCEVKEVEIVLDLCPG